MSRLQHTQEIVEDILRSNPLTRNDDDFLYLKVVAKINPNALNMSFGQFMKIHCLMGIPKFESVRRARQKLQSKYRELRPSADVEAGRILEEQNYKNWVTDHG